MVKVSFLEVLFSFLLWLIIYAMSNSSYKKHKLSGGISYSTYILMLVVFCTLAYYVGDFPHYAINYKECLMSSTPIHVEPVYFWLMKNVPHSYLFWRFVVWGGAVILWVMMYRRMKIPRKYACMAMTLVLLYYFAAPRQSLAFAILFLSLTFIFYPMKNKSISYIIAFVGIYLSLFFHRSMIMYVLLVVLAFIPLKKTFFIGTALAFPFLYGAVLLYSFYFIEFFFEEGTTFEKGIRYLSSESQGGLTIWGWIQFAVTRVPIFYLILYCIWHIYIKKKQLPPIFKVLVKYAYVCMYIGLLFFQQETSSFLSPRFLDATYYPLAIVLGYFLIQENKSKQIKVILNMFLFSNLYLFAYTLYKL